MKHSIVYSEYSKENLSLIEDLIQKNHGKLNEYVSQLHWWNKKVNLISRDVSHETLMEHVAHSLLLSQLEVFKKSTSIIDTGSGGGLPGLPLAICYPDKKFVLNDIVAKKMMAVKQMAIKLGVKNVGVNTGSIAKMEIKSSDLLVSKHAFKVFELIDFIRESSWEQVLFLKGEIEAVEEINNTEIPLSATIINLDRVLSTDFYKGKAIVHVTKINE